MGAGKSVDSARIQQEAYRLLRKELEKAAPAYLEDVRLTHESGNQFRITAPTMVVRSDLELNHKEPINKALSALVPGGVRVVFDVAGDVHGPGVGAIGEHPGPIWKLPPNPRKDI